MIFCLWLTFSTLTASHFPLKIIASNNFFHSLIKIISFTWNRIYRARKNSFFYTLEFAKKINFLLRYVTDILDPIYYSQKGFLSILFCCFTCTWTSTDNNSKAKKSFTMLKESFCVTVFIHLFVKLKRRQSREYLIRLALPDTLTTTDEMFCRMWKSPNKLMRTWFSTKRGLSPQVHEHFSKTSSCSETFTLLACCPYHPATSVNENAFRHPSPPSPLNFQSQAFLSHFVSPHNGWSEGWKGSIRVWCKWYLSNL